MELWLIGSNEQENFDDADEICDYAKDAMEAFIGGGIVLGSGSNLDSYREY